MTDAPGYTAFGFTDQEWGLVTGLPQSVLTAASAAAPNGTRKTRAENAAGLAAIADGRASASPLVSAVATELTTRVGDPELGEELPIIEPADPTGYADDVLGRAAAVTRLLAARVGDGDAGAYRRWLVDIAETVVSAATTGGVFGIGGADVTETERAFCEQLSHVLSD
ncbi:MAG TPA: hypothetical protein VFO77_11890 [Actinoplanes sp.]|nr:hypothetical protein [Actinoplanes sp.]